MMMTFYVIQRFLDVFLNTEEYCLQEYNAIIEGRNIYQAGSEVQMIFHDQHQHIGSWSAQLIGMLQQIRGIRLR